MEDHPDGVFAQFSRFYGNDCGITVCGQYDDDNRFHVEYYYPFFRGTGITTQEQVTVERHADKDAFSAACDDLRIGITLIFYLQNAAEYMKESKKQLTGNQPLTLSGLAGEGKILFPVLKDKEAVKVEQESSKNRSSMIAAARNGDEEAMMMDRDYIGAMEYGMPPISGWGIGIDRLVQILTDADNIKDCVMFPLMKPEE